MTTSVVCKDVFGNEFICSAEELEVRIGVYAVIIKNDSILLARQWDGYSIIGGGVDKGESLEDALIREVNEETGLTITPGKLIHNAVTYFKRDASSQPFQSYQFYFNHADLSGELHNNTITESEATYTNGIPEWVPLDSLNTITFRHSITLESIIEAYKRNS